MKGENSGPGPLLSRIFLAAPARPVLTLLIALALSAGSILYTVRGLEFHTSQKDLIHPEHRLIRLSALIERIDELDTFVVAIENREAGRSLAFLKALVPHLQTDRKNFRQVFYRVSPEQFRRWSLLYLKVEELKTIRERLLENQDFIRELARSPGLVSLFREINREMTARLVGEVFTGFLEPEQRDLDLDFLLRLLGGLEGALDGSAAPGSPWETFFSAGAEEEEAEGYFWTSDKRYLLLFVTPRKVKGSFADTWDSLKALRAALARVRSDFPGIQAGVTGPEALNADEMGVAFRDMSLATLLSLGGLVLLLVLFWRGIRRPLSEMITLLAALALTFGLITFFIGHLNILSVTFAPLVLGLGIDYGVHWISRYREEEEAGRPAGESLRVAMDRTGAGILLAGIAAALSFSPLALTGFRGLMELGIICSLGMIVATLTTLFLLPALVLLLDRPRPPAAQRGRPALRPFFHLSRERSLMILILAGLASGLGLWAAGQVDFDLNLLNLQARGVESVVWEKKLLAQSRRSSMYGAVLAGSLEEAQRKEAALSALPTVSEVVSVASLIPERQEEKIALLREMAPVVAAIGPMSGRLGPVHPGELDQLLGRINLKMEEALRSPDELSPSLGGKMDRVRSEIGEIRRRLNSPEFGRAKEVLSAWQKDLFRDLDDKIDLLQANARTRPMRSEDLPPPLLERFVAQDGRYLLRVFPREDIWEPGNLARFVRDLRSVDPEAVGDPVTLHVFTQAFRQGLIKAAIYAGIFILLLLLFTFRSVTAALLAMAPLVVGTVWTMGLMFLFGVDLNLANSTFLPLVVGAGVEYGIIIVHRWRQRKEGTGGEGIALPASTAKGVLLAGLTTTVGFGSLAVSAHRGIHSLGLLAMVGSLSILAAALLVLPSLLALISNGPSGKSPLPPPSPWGHLRAPRQRESRTRYKGEKVGR